LWKHCEPAVKDPEACTSMEGLPLSARMLKRLRRSIHNRSCMRTEGVVGFPHDYLVVIASRLPVNAAFRTPFMYLSISPFSGSRGTGMLSSFISNCGSLAAFSILSK